MKTPPFLRYGCPAICLVIMGLYFATYQEVERLPFHAALVARERAGFGKIHTALVELDLSDAQWRDIERLRETIRDRRQRLEAITRLLTPAQRVRFAQLRAARANAKAASLPVAEGG